VALEGGEDVVRERIARQQARDLRLSYLALDVLNRHL
jgi:hypothetical protein